MNKIWVYLIAAYGNRFSVQCGEDWSTSATGKVWALALAEQPMNKLVAGFKELTKKGLAGEEDFPHFDVFSFLRLCPTDAKILGLPNFENLWHDVQLSKYSERNKYVKWILANASKHECDFNLLRNNNKTSEKQMRKMYQALINFSKNGGQLQDEAEKPAIEEKIMEKSEFLKHLEEIQKKNGLVA